jgi:hypothetical protein
MKVLLLVTWIVNSATSSYQVEFENREKCEAARSALINDQVRISGNAQMTPLGFQRPEVSAICANQ